MKIHVLPVFDKEQNEINVFRVLCQSIWLKGDSNTPKGSCSLDVLEQCHSENKLGCGWYHQDPVSGTFHYFNYCQVKSWNFRKLFKHLSSGHQMVSALWVSMHYGSKQLFKGAVGEIDTDKKSLESQPEFKENASPSPLASSIAVTSDKSFWLSRRLRHMSEDLAKQSNLCGSALGTGRAGLLMLTVEENSPLWGKCILVKWPWESEFPTTQ